MCTLKFTYIELKLKLYYINASFGIIHTVNYYTMCNIIYNIILQYNVT